MYSEDGIRYGKYAVIINRYNDYECHFCNKPIKSKFITLIRGQNGTYFPVCPICEVSQ